MSRSSVARARKSMKERMESTDKFNESIGYHEISEAIKFAYNSGDLDVDAILIGAHTPKRGHNNIDYGKRRGSIEHQKQLNRQAKSTKKEARRRERRRKKANEKFR